MCPFPSLPCSSQVVTQGSRHAFYATQLVFPRRVNFSTTQTGQTGALWYPRVGPHEPEAEVVGVRGEEGAFFLTFVMSLPFLRATDRCHRVVYIYVCHSQRKGLQH